MCALPVRAVPSPQPRAVRPGFGGGGIGFSLAVPQGLLPTVTDSAIAFDRHKCPLRLLVHAFDRTAGHGKGWMGGRGGPAGERHWWQKTQNASYLAHGGRWAMGYACAGNGGGLA